MVAFTCTRKALTGDLGQLYNRSPDNSAILTVKVGDATVVSNAPVCRPGSDCQVFTDGASGYKLITVDVVPTASTVLLDFTININCVDGAPFQRQWGPALDLVTFTEV